ncbi:MAG: glycosyltransferase [Lachnospiraceae bacterium]|nr:glycosyltransferase [Lachnospiraceae bacterium]
MKILHIVEAFGGGVYTFMEALLKQTSEEFEIVVAYALRPQTPVDFLERFDKKIEFIEVKHFQRSINPANDFSAGFELRQIVKRVKPDVIHLHSAKAGFLGRVFLNNRKIPTLYTPHGYAFMKKDDSFLKRMIYYGIEWMAGRSNALTVGCSKGEWEAAKKVSRKAICISNGIDYSELPEPQEERTSNKLLVATIGRVCYQKNPEMFNRVALAMPEADFLWVGEGDMDASLTAPNIVRTGWKTREETLQLLNKADVFLLLSLWEGLPISLLEAMYLKKVCIVTDVVGNRDVIVHGENGYIVENDTECVGILKRINGSTEGEQELRENAHGAILNCYNIANMGENYAKEYRKLCSERK